MDQEKNYSISGRITSVRFHKKSIFFDVFNGYARIQVMADRELFSKSPIISGDIISAEGYSGFSRTNEPTFFAKQYSVVVRPKEYRGEDKEMVELIYDRSRLTSQIRDSLSSRGFMEVNSPILSRSGGCSKIRPFKTVDIEGEDLFLRFTLELELKKQICRTQLPVFEIGKVFRNMGEDRRHYREYTVVEAYLPYKTLDNGLDVIEDMFRKSLMDFGKEVGEIPKFKIKDLCGRLSEEPLSGDGLKLFYSKQVKTLPGPFFALFPPKEWSPLSTHNLDGTAKDAELIYRGTGIAHICEENPNYDEIIKIFEEQNKQGQDERHDSSIDQSFLAELKNGMPPCVGFCMGLDRLLMVLKDKENVRRVIPFAR